MLPTFLPSPDQNNSSEKEKMEDKNLIFDSSFVQFQRKIPDQFIWPDHEKPCLGPPELKVPPSDLKAFLSKDPEAISSACSMLNDACKKHGFFLVVNHGVDTKLLNRALELIDDFFSMKFSEKQKAQRKVGEHCGYASSFIGRFSSKLPWKETLSFRYAAAAAGADQSGKTVEEYFVNVMGEDFREFG